MSFSVRKRFRPLEPAEERSIHAGQRIYLGLLEDETNYCLSWPAAPLTALLQARSGATQPSTAATASSTTSSHPHHSTSTRSCASQTVVVPCVYTAADMGQLPADMQHLLLPLASASECFAPVAAEAPVPAPHPLAPSRPKSITEDSVFTLTAAQREQVAAAGILDLVRAQLQTATTTTTTTTASTAPSEEEPDAAAVCLVEAEVVGLEWRTYAESQRTAAALQRLLSLDAAVPFLPSGHPAADVWRRRLYDLWLHAWRRPAGAAADHLPGRVHVHKDSELHPWGPTLLAGAFMPGAQSDYFMVPAMAASDYGGGRGTAAGGGGGWAPPLTRRRTAYHFLRWRVERYLLLLPQQPQPSQAQQQRDALVSPARSRRAAAAAAAETEPGSPTATTGGNSSSTALLSAKDAEALLQAVTAQDRSLLDLEMDESRDDPQEALRLLAWGDLTGEAAAWQSLLSKMTATTV